MGSHIPADQFDYYKSRIKTYHQFAGNEAEVPIMTLTEHLRTRQPYRQASYNKSYIAKYFPDGVSERRKIPELPAGVYKTMGRKTSYALRFF
ncbi:MAG: hypothetical protein IPH57_13905 [Saprospiraceae bacterium]|nr:hypothetical protein [Saprospiraceae bacterium]